MGNSQNIRLPRQTHKKNLSLSYSAPMARLFKTIFSWYGLEKSETLFMSPIVSINKHPQKTGLILLAPKIDHPNFTNIETCPKSLNYRHARFWTNYRCAKFSKLSNQDSNLQLLPAKTSLTSYYEILFIKKPFIIKFLYENIVYYKISFLKIVYYKNVNHFHHGISVPKSSFFPFFPQPA